MRSATLQPEPTAFAEVLAELRAIRAVLESQGPRERATNLLTIAEVAKKICQSEDSVMRLIRAGALRASNVGNGTKKARWVVDEAEVVRFIDSRATASAPAKKKPSARKKSGTPNYF
jgi:helix-turn-helix protein